MLLIVLNGIEMGRMGMRRKSHTLLIVLNGIEIFIRFFCSDIFRLLIVLNGIEIRLSHRAPYRPAAFNRTKWN